MHSFIYATYPIPPDSVPLPVIDDLSLPAKSTSYNLLDVIFSGSSIEKESI